MSTTMVESTSSLYFFNPLIFGSDPKASLLAQLAFDLTQKTGDFGEHDVLVLKLV